MNSQLPGGGVYAYELDYAKGGDNQMTLTILADGAPIGAAALLSLTPAAVSSTTGRAIAEFALTARNGAGFVLAGLPVAFTVTGA